MLEAGWKTTESRWEKGKRQEKTPDRFHHPWLSGKVWKGEERVSSSVLEAEAEAEAEAVEAALF